MATTSLVPNSHARHLTDFAKIDVHIQQTWPVERPKVDRQIQTGALRKGVAQCQTHVAQESVATQTNICPSAGLGAGLEDNVALQKFLPDMTRVLEEALGETSPVNLDYFSDCLDIMDDLNPDVIFELKPSDDEPWLSSLVITNLAWNATGLIIAASYGRKDLQGWCQHPGALCTWKVDLDSQPSRESDLTVGLDDCLMCIAFHPREPYLIAGGTYNGQVYLWDLSKADPQQAVSQICNASHVDPVTQISWHRVKLEGSQHAACKERFQIVTISTDGRVLIWSTSNLCRPIYGYELLYPRLQTTELLEWGGTCMSFPPGENCGSFVVGTEGGTIYKCVFQHSAQNVDDFNRQSGSHGEPWRTIGVKMKSPIKTEYAAHVGPVHAVNFCPFHRYIFVSCGFDGFIGLYNTLQVKPILRLEPSGGSYLLCAQWSPFRPLVLAVGSGNGCLFLYDLQRSRLHARQVVRVSQESKPVHALAFNPHMSEYIAAADGTRVRMYLLGMSLTRERETERRELACLAELSAEDYDL